MVDSTDRQASIALRQPDGTVAARRLEVTGGVSAQLIPAIDALLASSGTRLDEIDTFGGVTGPGSFTGIRVGLAAIQGFAEVYGKPAVGVSRLAALASAGNGHLRAPVLDARRGEVYAAVYSGDGGVALPEANLAWRRFLETIAGRSVSFVAQFGSVLDPDGVAPLPPGTEGLVAEEPLAHYAALLAVDEPRIPPERLEANYIRRSDAELKWREA